MPKNTALLSLTALTTLATVALAAPKVSTQSIIVNPAGPTVGSVTLINTDTGQPVSGYDPIPAGATLDLSKLPEKLSVRANLANQVGSVRFALDSNNNYRTENIAPFGLCGDTGGTGGKLLACPVAVFAPGTHHLSATAFASPDGGGAAGNGLQLNYTVIRQEAPAPLAVTSLTLIDADTDQPVPGFDPITAGAKLKLSALPKHLNVRANVAGGVRSVRFAWYSGKVLLENDPPFAMCSDTKFKNGQKGDYFACDPALFAPGHHQLTATPFNQMFAKGTGGQALVWGFDVER